MVTTTEFAWIVQDLQEYGAEAKEIKDQVALAIAHLDYARAMGWEDRVEAAINELGALL